VKLNAVVRRGSNEHTVVDLVRWARERGHIVRFIEYMDVGHTNGWRMDDVVAADQIIARIDAEIPLVADEPNYDGEVAQRWRFADGDGEVGVISSVTQPFCATCTRARLSADGRLYTCLFATQGTDLRALLRAGATDGELSQAVASVWAVRDDRYSELRSAVTADLERVEMSYIGG
jgi:cyclic pyranopterin phosphate synthase